MKAFLFPGQGSQRKGMGADLFSKYPEYVKKADEILAYSIEELCLSDAENRLNYTAYTQPAIFVVSVLTYLDELKTAGRPDFVAGHSIGEYTALFVADVFDFETGLRIVQKRAELMSKAEGGGLAAVIGLSQDEVEARIRASNLSGIEIANINSPTQIVIGSKAEIIQEFVNFSNGQSGRVIPLRVSGAFHTSYMREAQGAFRDFLDAITFRTPLIPVISNYTAQPHNLNDMAVNLANHLANPVRWAQCIENMVRSGVETFTEIGSKILTPMVNDIRDHLVKQSHHYSSEPIHQTATLSTTETSAFCTSFGFKNPMVVGSTGYGAAGVELISNLSRDGILSFLDTYRLSLTAIESALKSLSADPELAGKYGVSLTFNTDSADFDESLIALCLRYAVRFVEVRGYFEPTAALLRYRVEGGLDDKGRPNNRIILRVVESGTVTSFLVPIANLVASEKTSESNPINEIPLIDAVCVDTKSWRSTNVNDLAAFQEVLDQCRNQGSSRLPFGKFFVGLSGLSVTQKPVETALAKGADFALISSVFLLAEEARLDDSIKSALSNAPERHFKETFDWAYPACRTTSFSHVLNEQASEQIAALQQLYLKDDLNASALRELSVQYTSEDGNILSDTFINACEGMNKFEIRAALRERVRSSLPSHFLNCDSAFPDFAKWLNEQGASFPVGAVKLAGLIYSKNHVN
jgi:trans-AT polyketide synthase/acyltransferase/oxidoreductase domain-containing protein